MVTKEEIKREIDKLPENLLEEVLLFLKKTLSSQKNLKKITPRDFHGKLDHSNIRKSAYE